jgi:HlyD family secretion protein
MPSLTIPSVRLPVVWLSIGAGVLVSAVLLVGVSGCNNKSVAKSDASPTSDVLAVATVSPKIETIQRSIDQPGTLMSYEETPIYTKLAGYLLKVNVDIQDFVKKGQSLGVLWVPEVQQDVVVKETRVAQGKADLKLAEEMLEVARFNVEARETKVEEAKRGQERAKSECDRWQNEYLQDMTLVKQGILTRQSEDEALNQFLAAQARLEEAKAKVASAEASLVESKAKQGKAKEDVGVAQAKLVVLNSQYQEQKAWFNYSNITAPYDGIVTQRFVHTGHFVQPANSGTTSKSAEPLFMFMRTDRLRVVVQVPEADAPLVKDGADAIIRIDALNNREITEWFKLTDEAFKKLQAAKIPDAVLKKLNALKDKPFWKEDFEKELATVLSPDELKHDRDQIVNDSRIRCKVTRNSGSLNMESRTLRVEIFLDNPKQELKPGFYVNVSIIADLPNVMTLPVDAILIDGTQYYCFVVENGKAKRINVKIGMQNDRYVQLISKQEASSKDSPDKDWVNFTGNEKVIVSNLASIQDGQAITTK